jgi:hypothetical protein
MNGTGHGARGMGLRAKGKGRGAVLQPQSGDISVE